jgi:hypothetical protein
VTEGAALVVGTLIAAPSAQAASDHVTDSGFMSGGSASYAASFNRGGQVVDYSFTSTDADRASLYGSDDHSHQISAVFCGLN